MLSIKLNPLNTIPYSERFIFACYSEDKKVFDTFNQSIPDG